MNKRKPYSKSDVQKLKHQRTTKTRKLSKLSSAEYNRHIGELKGVGHLYINNLVSVNTNANPTSGVVYMLEFTGRQSGEGEAPHFIGYAQSASRGDASYQVKGWFNLDNTIRIEIVQ